MVLNKISIAVVVVATEIGILGMKGEGTKKKKNSFLCWCNYKLVQSFGNSYQS